MSVDNPRHIKAINEAHGKARLLAVGVGKYPHKSGLSQLQAATNDAIAVKEIFLDIAQLNVDKKFCIACTAQSSSPPTRGEILRLLADLSDGADPSDRLIFYYSGHGLRLTTDGMDDFFIVPQDAFVTSDPDLLISFTRIKAIINQSKAKQKIIILDACFSGPDVSKVKRISQVVSPKFLADALTDAKGTVILASSGLDQTSTAQSPGNKLSLFTYYLCQALSGEENALEDGKLTVDSVYRFLSREVPRRAKSYGIEKQEPTLSASQQGQLILADFTLGLLTPAGIELDEQPISQVTFVENVDGKVKDVLTDIKRFSAYSQEYLEEKVNKNLSNYFGDRLAKYAAALTEIIGIPVSEITVEEGGIALHDAGYTIAYESQSQSHGVFKHEVWFSQSWFGAPDQMLSILRLFHVRPDEITFDLTSKSKVSLESTLAGARARGWKLSSNRIPRFIEIEQDSYTVRITADQVKITGFAPEEILGSESEPATTALLNGLLSLLS